MASQNEEVYDLLILVDATYSMSSYLTSLQTSLPQIISISTLTDCFSRIGLLAYRDYCDEGLLEWSDWFYPGSLTDEPQVDLIAKAKYLEPLGGGDGPEATKTGLARAYELMRENATTIVLLYTDAPPHTRFNGQLSDTNSNLGPELRALKVETSYSGFGPEFADLTTAAKLLSGRKGNKKAQIFSILQPNMYFQYAGYYNYLSTMTRGATFYLTAAQSADISKITVEILLSWMGAEKAGTSQSTEFPAYMSRYISIDGIKTLKSENDPAANNLFFFATTDWKEYNAGEKNLTKVRASSEILKKFMPKKSTPVDFVKRYKEDERYRTIAVDQLKNIIDQDVAAISFNPVFGSLWRVVCNDKDNERRDEVITAFGLQVDRIKDANEKERMKAWLEESYDYTAEVMEAIESVPIEKRFPCVCLDPTLVFKHESDVSDDLDESNKPITFFRRDELLEIGRSCDYKILRRLGRVLTRLTYINSAEEMPAHIANASETETPRIPMSLASREYGRKFWKILLHIVVPGTMLGARPGALLAALSIRLGVQPLIPAAEEEMLRWPNRWNDLEVPETWNMGCLGLLLDADRAYRTRHEEEEEIRDVSDSALDERPAKRLRLESYNLLTPAKPQATREKGLLLAKDRVLFEKLVSYKMLELNLETVLTARIGWTPDKTSVQIGPIVTCKSCELPRSVTIMGAQGKCGFCLWTQYASAAEKEEHTHERCKKEDDEKTRAVWVECNLRSCRAQYVIYRPQALNVKPKCHYCRSNTVAPVVECTQCLNRIIWPKEYRTTELKDFKCFACTAGRKTIVSVETTANKVSAENTTAWLLHNKDNKIAEPFNKRSLFHTISTAGTDKFAEKVGLLPASAQGNLLLNGKLIRNSPDLVKQLESWVSRRRTEQGLCTICFSSFRKDALLPSCGRSGCSERVCKPCLEGWYGVNGPGKIINTTTCLCPFCRRAPTAKTLSKYGMGIHAVADLGKAIRESGKWISAWCQGCGHAKRYLERVCAAGAPAELTEWSCDECLAEAAKAKGKEWARFRECPRCKVTTEKTGGCNHITCTCGQHWCFVCGEGHLSSDIYIHMQEAHGGYFDGGEDLENAEADEEWH